MGLAWTRDELLLLWRCYPEWPAADLALLIPGRSPRAMSLMARQIGVKKMGNAGRFQKGHNNAWNKGLKGYKAGGRSAETRFKKGQRPPNTLPIGSYRISKDGTLQRKFSDAPGGPHKRWRAVHELVWIEHNGPLPPGHICVFKDKMATATLAEITIDRIECISLAENMRRNTRHRLPPEIANLIALRGALNRVINRIDREGDEGEA